MRTICLTFESWYSKYEWYEYSNKNKYLEIPMLTDRSPCSDPFFDIYSNNKRPLLSGLCRAKKHYTIGDRYVYITKINKRICKEKGFIKNPSEIHYCLVASLIVKKTFDSHELAAESFKKSKFTVHPEETNHPPNLITSDLPECAISKDYCIVVSKAKKGKQQLAPDKATIEDWKYQYHLYDNRKKKKNLRVAECEYEILKNGKYALIQNLNKKHIITESELQFFYEKSDSPKMNTMGRKINESKVQDLLTNFF
ncbi:hypothetical protein MHH81_15320 [Psychrobacillus sp. FSL H8-0484]|uniref:hypothetical protein n=1 Tax=Psychrobacillus sp. FSL H8-0484 TaxID=2921390 RepID=UPI0030FADA79